MAKKTPAKKAKKTAKPAGKTATSAGKYPDSLKGGDQLRALVPNNHIMPGETVEFLAKSADGNLTVKNKTGHHFTVPHQWYEKG